MPLRLAGEALEVNGVNTLGWVREIRAGDANPALRVDQKGTGRVLELCKNGLAVWFWDNNGNLLATVDGGPDIGQAGVNRLRHIYTWGDVWVGNWLRTGYGAFLGGTTASWWKFSPEASRFLIRDDTSALDKLALVRGALAADGDTALSLERRAAGIATLVAVKWFDDGQGHKVLYLAS